MVTDVFEGLSAAANEARASLCAFNRALLALVLTMTDDELDAAQREGMAFRQWPAFSLARYGRLPRGMEV